MLARFSRSLSLRFTVTLALLASLYGIARADDLLVVDYTYQDSQDPGKSFKMQVPNDWNVKEDFGGYALFMEPKVKTQPTAENPIAADPNITVAVVNTPKFIDDRGLDDYAKEIEQKFRLTNGGSNDFNIFAKNLLTDLPGGKRALMYYTTYTNNGVDVGSTIVLMSSEKYMYRITYTDSRVMYEKNFEKFYPVMISLDFPGATPEREPFFVPLIPYVSVVLVIVIIFALLRRRKAAQVNKLIREVESENEDDDSMEDAKPGEDD